VADAGRGQWKAFLKPLCLLNRPPGTLASSLQSSMPGVFDGATEGHERPRVRRYAVVADVPTDHGAQPALLSDDGIVLSS
jgi:hypothetical protein